MATQPGVKLVYVTNASEKPRNYTWTLRRGAPKKTAAYSVARLIVMGIHGWYKEYPCIGWRHIDERVWLRSVASKRWHVALRG